MKHQVTWNIDVAKIITIILIFILILLGYQQFDLSKKIGEVEKKVDNLQITINENNLNSNCRLICENVQREP